MSARKKYHEETTRITVTMKREMLDWVDQEATIRGTDRPEVIHEALRQWRNRLEKSRGKETTEPEGESGGRDLPGQQRFVD